MTKMEPTAAQLILWFDEALRMYGVNSYEELNFKNFPHMDLGFVVNSAARLAYAAGADAELEACLEELDVYERQHACIHVSVWLRAARRPKLPSLKQRALKAFYSRHSEPQYYRDVDGNEALISPDLYADMALIEQALQALPDD
jgi:hypothetical protein